MPARSPSHLDDAPTPVWWQQLPTVVQLALLTVFLPGVLLHEVTHAIAAWPWAQPAFQWGHLAVDLHWRPHAPESAVWLAHLAPFLIGWAIGLIVLAATMDGFEALLQAQLPMLAYVIFNWSAYTWLVLWDVDALSA